MSITLAFKDVNTPWIQPPQAYFNAANRQPRQRSQETADEDYGWFVRTNFPPLSATV